MGLIKKGASICKRGKIPCKTYRQAKGSSGHSHHVVQNAAVRNVPGYDRNDAPAITLGCACHKKTYKVQRQRRNPVGYPEERRVASESLRAAGVGAKRTDDFLTRCVDPYFSTLATKPGWRQPGK